MKLFAAPCQNHVLQIKKTSLKMTFLESLSQIIKSESSESNGSAIEPNEELAVLSTALYSCFFLTQVRYGTVRGNSLLLPLGKAE